MRVESLQWGNSLALRVPKVFAEKIGAVSENAWR
jgi:antitoxin component of MazEF toxin-antitoxin module